MIAYRCIVGSPNAYAGEMLWEQDNKKRGPRYNSAIATSGRKERYNDQDARGSPQQLTSAERFTSPRDEK